MPLANRFEASIDAAIEQRINMLHTQTPCKITSISSTGIISAKPLTSVSYNGGDTIEMPELSGIPPLVMWDGGSAYATMPVKAGTTVLVFFAERDNANFLNGDGSSTVISGQLHAMGLFPTGWIPLPTKAKGVGINYSPTDIQIVNDKASVKISPTSLTAATAGGSFSIDNSGNIVMNNGSGQAQLSSSGEMNVNGCVIDVGGNLTNANGVNLQDFYDLFISHYHGNVQSGNSNTSTYRN